MVDKARQITDKLFCTNCIDKTKKNNNLPIFVLIGGFAQDAVLYMKHRVLYSTPNNIYAKKVL